MDHTHTQLSIATDRAIASKVSQGIESLDNQRITVVSDAEANMPEAACDRF